MTIKQKIEKINEILYIAYNNLQSLPYENVIENFVQIKLLDMTDLARDLLEFTVHTKEDKKRRLHEK